MAAQIRVLRRRIRSTQSIKKITRSQELIATSRIAKARARVDEARPYAELMTSTLSELASNSALDHPLLVEREQPKRAAVLVVTSDRGQCGGYNANVLKEAEKLQSLLREQGKEPVLYVIGRKGVSYYRFRNRDIEQSWTGFSEQPGYEHAAEAARTLVDAFMAGEDDGDGNADGVHGVDELHLVYTSFKNMITQIPQARRMAPLEVEYAADSASAKPVDEDDRTADTAQSQVESPGSKGLQSLYEFEPDPDTLFDALLPKYIGARLYAALLESAASESANRQRAMKAATDNANELIRSLTLEANQARQAQITQEISEIVGGVDALASAGSES
ncbi:MULTISPECIES: F0F1 ATP synthase subunit gamma [unclassified Pseudonocardia]|jgi:F-type H+-transporting ATPase subunit gamma|uniref:F0F1 ATP synthase subunit gamma n=1 Tax=unclassified Pseudonocardia TaxID=2619320 RepID=UPI0001FFE9F9|nr:MULTISPECIES: F0F1 ATP synthase subunit gamma [unclassified Pseudonocardia]ALE72394.1 ATP synthase F0F1 subunit gamma [Pseudonocardia sp. EC080625-04]ALL75694.1 ATP synthase F0F1 subunit gamma [Pseudonocardia sp. EC080610-09]ALL82721.1 ATP synthase F0F1 subunit gamma [Pseudonocardia sp. EC080619-01]OLM20420.1 ATP synthase gamma chain [Pseudonocardia sp. Ae707_Ps1]